ncbi:MAG: pantoate--beta-alanine ligase [Kofleriaceae bacterium]|nr:pantoate--beta-alanine ligase [Kofleriaceae bacterium]
MTLVAAALRLPRHGVGKIVAAAYAGLVNTLPSRLPFEIFRDPATMRAKVEDLRRDGLRIAVVPTMGFLHAGHLSLLREARRSADVVILTIFVNPTQFGPNEDLRAYPRDEAGDLAKAQTCGVDFAFCPEASAMYPLGAQTFIEVRELSQPMCGEKRPGHFTGVATIVAKLFNITRPHVAFFGDKDFQQLAVIRQMTRDLDFGIEIIGMPIIREPDGLALSSRNVYLTPADRQAGLSLSQGLAAAAAALAAGQRDAHQLVAIATAPITAQPRCRIDYIELRDAASLQPIVQINQPAVLAMAIFVGSETRVTRLIDNRVLR